MNQRTLAIGVTLVVVAIVLLSGSAAWATNDQAPLAQTIPTPETPTPTPTRPVPPPPPPWPWYPGWYPGGWGPSPWGMPGAGGPGCYPVQPRPVFRYCYSWGYSWSTAYYTPWQQTRLCWPNWPTYPVSRVW